MHSVVRLLLKVAALTAGIFHCCNAFAPPCLLSSGAFRSVSRPQVQRVNGVPSATTGLGAPTQRQQHLTLRTPGRHDPVRVGPLLMAMESGESGQEEEGGGRTEEGGEPYDPRIYSVRISRVTGIEWGTDLSFKWVYVRALHPSGAAENCGQISVGDQLIAINDVGMTGAPFDFAMNAMIALEGPDVEFTFFRGTQAELKEVTGADSPPEKITVTVLQKGKPQVTLTAPSGTNLRNLLTDNGINVYQSVTRWTNCKGKQLCGTCIVEINEGLEDCTVRSLDESSTLRDNPANYRLSCVTNMYDDVTVTVFPPIGASQWTR